MIDRLRDLHGKESFCRICNKRVYVGENGNWYHFGLADLAWIPWKHPGQTRHDAIPGPEKEWFNSLALEISLREKALQVSKDTSEDAQEPLSPHELSATP